MVLRLSIFISLLFALCGVLAPDALGALMSQLQGLTIARFGWFYLLAIFGFSVLAAYLALGPMAHVKLGRDDEEPEFSRSSWFAMLFSAGMGVGLLFWGVGEPLSHFGTPPIGVEAQSPAAAQGALRYTFFHWGLHPWATYSVMALALAYFGFRRGEASLISVTLRPVLGRWVDGGLGKAIDVLAVLATVFGVATSLGLGALQISSGLQHLFGIQPSFGLSTVIVLVATVLFLGSALTGVSRGIRYLSNLNMLLALALLLLVFVLGPTAFILDAFTTTLGSYLGNLVGTSLRLAPFTQDPWVSNWTLFYWAWWVTWAPFVGTFIARISRGRTVREFVVGVVLIPALACFAWFAVFGGAGLKMQIFDHVPLLLAVKSDVSTALYLMFEQLPGGALISGVAMLLMMSFFVTSADSATFVLGSLSQGGTQQPGRRVQMLWGLLMAGIALALLRSGGLQAIQSAVIVTALPFAVVMVLLAVALFRVLRQEVGAAPQR